MRGSRTRQVRGSSLSPETQVPAIFLLFLLASPLSQLATTVPGAQRSMAV